MLETKTMWKLLDDKADFRSSWTSSHDIIALLYADFFRFRQSA
jgi:hypothetical protein